MLASTFLNIDFQATLIRLQLYLDNNKHIETSLKPYARSKFLKNTEFEQTLSCRKRQSCVEKNNNHEIACIVKWSPRTVCRQKSGEISQKT
jgi:hypothetical protein